MSTIKKIAQSGELCILEAPDNQYHSKIWFKTEPVDRDFCYRVAQLQLTTDSRDQGFVDDKKAGSWSWFELAILPNAEATEPVIKDQRTLVWRSHSNRIGVNDMSRLFGVVFDRRGELLDDLEPGNVIAVRVCARFPGWINNAERGELTAKILNEDLFSPQNWTLSSVKTPDIPTSLNNGVYTLSSTTECHVAAADNVLTSKIWFTSPALDEDVVAQIESIQLFTRSRNQNVVNDPDAGSWSWFDVVILDSPEATEPKINGGRSLAWSSHHNRLHDNSYTVHEGELFEGEHEMLRYLEAGNAIGVRICAQFDGWQNHAESGSLVVRISNIGPRDPPPYLPNVESFRQMGEQVQETITQLYQELAPSDLPPYESITTASLGIRIDEDSGVGKRPLRLLSLDGGGVRGISSLEVLKTVMKHVGENVKPCDYFDMIAGTSTGGLIAIMLGRLEMTVDECIEAYNALSKKIFSASSIVGQIKGAKYDANVLEEEIRKIVKKYGGDENATMLTKKENCKVFVVTVRADAVQKVVHSRTYSNPKAPSVYGDWKIWQAARATSAAPSYFEQIQIGDCAFVDGGLGFNNPVMELVKESFAVFGLARPIGCLLTIGTGITPDVSVGKATLIGGLDLAKAILAVATSCERAHETIEGIAPVFPEIGKDKYYRFNVGKDIAKWIQVAKDPKWYQLISKAQGKKVENWAQAIIEMDDYANMDRFVALTGTYLKNEETRVRECGLKLKGSKVAKA